MISGPKWRDFLLSRGGERAFGRKTAFEDTIFLLGSRVHMRCVDTKDGSGMVRTTRLDRNGDAARRGGVRDEATGSQRSESGRRRFLAEPQMRPVVVIIADVLRQKPLQMFFADGDHMIEQVPTATLDPNAPQPLL